MMRELVLSFLAVVPGCAGILTTSANCNLNFPNGPFSPETMTDPSSCTVGFSNSSAHADSRATAGAMGSFGVQTFVSAFGWDSGDSVPFLVDAFGNATAEQLTTIMPNGPVRNGFVKLAFIGGGDPGGDDTASVSGSFGGYQCLPPFGRGGECIVPGLYPTGMLPVTLGIPIDIDLRASASAVGDGIGSSGGAQSSLDVRFTLLESDQTTQVGWIDMTGQAAGPAVTLAAPEPRAIALCAVALSFISLTAQRRKNRL
jgi:hypothetical protein